MFRRIAPLRMSMTGSFINEHQERAGKKGWKELFFKPQTRDERVKDYVPEVLEESLAAQRAVLAKENTERDLIVEHGQKMLKDLENKAPVTNMFGSFQALLKLYKKENLVTQRAMHLLMYPSSTQVGTVTQAAVPELVSSFGENFRAFIDTVEQNGSYVHDVKWKAAAAAAAAAPAIAIGDGASADAKQLEAGAAGLEVGSGGGDATTNATTTAEGQIANEDEPVAPAAETEPLDITLYIKCLAGMSMANARLNDTTTAIKCADAALEHAMDPNRKGGVLALKAGLLVQAKKYIEAAETAQLAIACAPNNAQGYLQGATAMRLMGKGDEAVELLKLGALTLPNNDAIAGLLGKTMVVHDAAPKQLGESSAPVAKQEAPPQVTAS